jgi:beta-galactosidase
MPPIHTRKAAAMGLACLIVALVSALELPAAAQSQPPPDPYLRTLYESLNDSPVQQKMRRLRPWPVGVVFIPRPGMTLDDCRRHFRLMRQLGFTCLKQLMSIPELDSKAIMHAALDEGIIPWWYDEAGGEDPTPETLRSLGLEPSMTAAQWRANPVWQRRQMEVMRSRIDQLGSHRRPPPPALPDSDGMPGTLSREQFGITPEAGPLFVKWLQDRYGSLPTLRHAWNFAHSAARPAPWQSWDELGVEIVPFINAERREYRRMVDVFRFRADLHLQDLARERDRRLALDPREPIRAGGEMGLFLPFAYRSTDMEGIASVMRDGGSFYPSIHPAWHFEEVDFEYVRPIYMQASIAVDWFKGGWAAAWESTGGPQQLDGGKAPFVPDVRDTVAGFTIDENTIQQLMISWMAAGFRGFGQWTWNARSFGKEAGEYALLNRHMEPGPRAVAAGRIGAPAHRLRDELWTARKEPLVGVFQDWESDAFWAALSVGARDMYRSFPVRARIGASRALINHNVPWEHVTARNLRAGLAGRYRVIHLPAQLALDSALLDLLRPWVEAGGRLVLDAPGAWYGHDGALLPTSPGSAFERIFGCSIDDYQYSRPNHRQWSVGDRPVDGFVLELRPTRARVVETFADGRPSVTEHLLGRGQAVVIGYAASLNLWRPGNAWLEERLVRHTLGPLASPYRCDGALAYRLAAPAADHYFLVNDGPAREVVLETRDFRYASAEEPVTGAAIDLSRPIALPANGARWIRCLKPAASP